MRHLTTHATTARAALGLLSRTMAFALVPMSLAASAPAVSPSTPTQDAQMPTIHGRFEVKMTPEAGELDGEGIQRFRLDKRYEGPLTAEAQGLMTAHSTSTAGSAGYVAIERVRGTLDGRNGSFVLQHSGLMSGDARQLSIEVIPDSADGELSGLRGRMGIRIEAGAHFYDFEYALPATR